jgi:protein-S-isoprenylcysteine O-methyltransferase Ste14
MKLKTIVFSTAFISVVIFMCPFILIRLNTSFGLPVFESVLLKSISIPFFMIEAIILFQSFALFRRFGRGSPIITEPTKRFVEKGVYRYVRNPLYIGHISMLFGIFLLFGHALLLFYPLMSFLVFHAYVVYVEEPELKKKFSTSYQDYYRRVRRWGLF